VERRTDKLGLREWSAEAASAEARGDLLVASLCFGIAKYPCLGNDAHAHAYDEQLRTYIDASRSFPLEFERRVLSVDYHGETTPVAVHIYRRPGRDRRRPRRPRRGRVEGGQPA
jgi:esterase FrsA